MTILLCVSFLHWPFAFQRSRTGFVAGRKLHAYIKMLQLPDLPLDEETTSFTVIPREKSSYLQTININVSNGHTQRRIVQCDTQEGLDFSITYHLTTNALRIITKTFTCFQIFMSARQRYRARD